MDLKLTGVSLMVLLLRFGAAAAVFVAIVVAAYVVASAPSRTASRLGLRGLKRQRALQSNEAWAAIEPMVRWLGVRVSGIPTEEQRAALDRQISLAGDYLGLTPDEYLALFIISGLAGAGAGAIAGVILKMGALLVIVGVILGTAAPYMIVSGEAQERQKNVSRGLPYVIDLMALAMGAGLDFPAPSARSSTSRPTRTTRSSRSSRSSSKRSTSVERAKTRCSSSHVDRRRRPSRSS